MVFANVSTIFTAEVDDELIQKNPCKAASVRRLKSVPKKVVWLGAGLGLRQGEIFALSPDDIDFERGELHPQERGRVTVTAPLTEDVGERADRPQHLSPQVGTIVAMAGSTLVRLGSIAQHRWGLVTTAQAEDAGVTRKQLSRLASTGAIERVAQGVYRMAGAPSQDNEAIYATWLALGGASTPRNEAGVSSIVAGGIRATVAHGIGDSFLDGFDFIVPARKGTRLPGVRLRIRELTRDEVIGGKRPPDADHRADRRRPGRPRHRLLAGRRCAVRCSPRRQTHRTRPSRRLPLPGCRTP